MAVEEGNDSQWSKRFCFQIIFTTLLFVLTQLTASAGNTATIRTQEKLTGNCKDYLGVQQGHEDTWPSSAGACDKNICIIVPSGNYLIVERCREITNDENPDSDNCHSVANSSLPFPGCCPDLQCSESPPITTPPSTSCSDLSPSFSCWFWSNTTLGCSPNGTYYNSFLKDFCRKTCQFCT
ncbi:uncharacterized protein LOC124284646 [Haliotis rubra]|uniref:uncharacterized protein LOC124284646 n=1 Tax=Haliotis rubra TaxID=36100 RepID=UPI001EE4F562|nr:uncharacterized protein LOC124284646 [Haliotis rubra]